MGKMEEKLLVLRRIITESLRVQRDTRKLVPYIDSGNFISDATARQNHAIFARRGCGKTLLLHQSTQQVDSDTKCVYLNCEDFKKHSFPNVLIEILDALFCELEMNLSGWFGKKRKSRELIKEIRLSLSALKVSPDILEEEIKEISQKEETSKTGVTLKSPVKMLPLEIVASEEEKQRNEVETKYKSSNSKLKELDLLLPQLKIRIREFFNTSNSVSAVFLQIDDLYHLKKSDQPFVMDYIHRLCKDVPLYFKVATLRHASLLYMDRAGQPIGAQERHDYQPINIDYNFANFAKTKNQNLTILYEFGKLSKMSKQEIDSLFKGEGFNRLVMAGGGVPRDTLSLFLEILSDVDSANGGKIGKDEVRILSRANFEKRIEELKNDSKGNEQDSLMSAIYTLRTYCLNKRINAVMIPEKMLQQNDAFRNLIYRLLDYRILHSAGTALTHKHHQGTFHAFVIDIGCYAHLRKLDKKFKEIDVSSPTAKEDYRSAPCFGPEEFDEISKQITDNVYAELMDEEDA
jgi:hypothetical protein